jgi:hypothetical protein
MPSKNNKVHEITCKNVFLQTVPAKVEVETAILDFSYGKPGFKAKDLRCPK